MGGGAFRGVCRAPWFRAQRAPAFGPGTQAGSAPVGGEGKCHLSAMRGVKAGRGTRCGEALDPRPPCGGRGTRCARGDPHKPSAPHNPPQKISPCGKSRRDLISNNLCISPRQTCRLSRTCRIFRICQPSQTSRLCPRRTPLALRLHRHARVPLP